MDMSLGQIFEKAVMNTLLGMGTVFLVLIFISLLISLFVFIPRLQEMFGKKQNTVQAQVITPETSSQTPTAQAETPAITEEPDGTELVAVITAAIAAWEGTPPEGLVIRSIKRAGKQRR